MSPPGNRAISCASREARLSQAGSTSRNRIGRSWNRVTAFNLAGHAVVSVAPSGGDLRRTAALAPSRGGRGLVGADSFSEDAGMPAASPTFSFAFVGYAVLTLVVSATAVVNLIVALRARAHERRENGTATQFYGPRAAFVL